MSLGCGVLYSQSVGAIEASSTAGAEVEANVDTKEIAVGERVKLAIRLDHDLADDARWRWPAFAVGDTLGNGWEVLSTSSVDTLMSDAFATGRQLLQRLEITHWDSGFQTVPSLVFLDTVGEGLLETSELQVRVTVPKVPPQVALTDIQGYAPIAWTFGERLMQAMPWLGALALVGVALWQFLRYLKRRTPAEVLEHAKPAAPVEPPHVVALRALRALDAEQLWQTGDAKGHHSRLTSAVKTYFESAFDVPMVDRSSSEVRQSIHVPPVGVSKVQAAELMALLDGADAVKFAKHKPSSDVHERALRKAISLVEELSKEAETNNDHGTA
jgi:hypothetical protein